MSANLRIKLPLGYKVNGLACGIKKSGKPDLGLIFSKQPAKVAGMFTANKIISGSVKLSQINLKRSHRFQGIIVNSGNANCFTSDNSLKRARDVVKELAHFIRTEREEILFASTGIIGRPLPVNQIKKAIPLLVKGLSESALVKIAQAIMTTDTFIKVRTTVLNIGQRSVRICGLVKGAGMIAPSLMCPKATMLCFILSDADITQKALRIALSDAVANSFNCITVDGCMSTNDTVFLMSNSCANNPKIQEGSRGFNKFSAALGGVCLDLAKMIIKDAEGASKFIQIKVKQARSVPEAKQVALSIANSNLLKAAMFGGSQNPGRIIAAVGASGVGVKEKNLKINVSALNKKYISIELKLNQGSSQAVVYTSDLTPEYVKINARYS